MDDFGALHTNNTHKQKCEELRKIRVKMAETLGIPEAVRKEPCNFDGECRGTCPACYMEEKALMDRIYELSQNGMMDMIFGDTAKEIQDNAHAFDTDNAFFGEAESIEGDIMYDDIDELEDNTVDDKDSKQVLKSINHDKTSGIPLTGLVIPPKEKEKTTDKKNKQKSPIKIPDFLKGKKK